MAVTSPTVTITVEEIPMVYALTIAVSPETGMVGDTFQFIGVLGYDSEPVIGETINLILEGVGVVGTTTTKTSPIPGYYSISWVADRAGTLSFHTEAPGLAAASKAVTLNIPFPPVLPEWWYIAAIGGGLALVTIIGVVAYQEYSI